VHNAAETIAAQDTTVSVDYLSLPNLVGAGGTSEREF
jgi:hypothetical protein